jgi:hypothetical protein
MSTDATIAALAGRRIDAADAKEPRFPLANVARVRADIAAALRAHQLTALVASAACGADLIALDEAEKLGIRRRIVLPFPVEEFRATSVIDRPGDWGDLYDRLVRAAAADGDLVVIDPVGGDPDAAYAAATEAILEQAQELAQQLAEARGIDHGVDLLAITVWEGQPRSGNDLTDAFRRLAQEVGFKSAQVLTV